MRWYYAYGRLAGFLLACLAIPAAHAQDLDPSAVKPQVIVRIVADDLGANGRSWDQGPDIPMPQLRALAAAGTSFADANATSPICVPSRAAMVLGRYPQRQGTAIWTNPAGHGEFQPLPRARQTMAEAMSQAGYRSIAIGKYPVEKTPAQYPVNNGYTEFLGLYRNGEPYTNPKLWRDANSYPNLFQGNITDILTSEAVDFLWRNQGQRLFLDLTPTAGHLPYQGTADQAARCAAIKDRDRRGFCTVMQGLDDQIGWVRWTLVQQGVLERSLIIVTGDNGCEVGCNQGPFRGKKGTPYEGGTRVPLIVSWPVRVAAGAEYEKPVSLMDIYPTIAAAANGGQFADPALDGVNLLPYLAGDPGLPHPLLFFSTRPSWSAVKADQWKLYQIDGKTELYNLDQDISERHNVAKQHPQVVKQLEQPLRKWRAELGPFRR